MGFPILVKWHLYIVKRPPVFYPVNKSVPLSFLGCSSPQDSHIVCTLYMQRDEFCLLYLVVLISSTANKMLLVPIKCSIRLSQFQQNSPEGYVLIDLSLATAKQNGEVSAYFRDFVTVAMVSNGLLPIYQLSIWQSYCWLKRACRLAFHVFVVLYKSICYVSPCGLLSIIHVLRMYQCRYLCCMCQTSSRFYICWY